MPSGNKSLPKPMLSHIYIYRHMASPGHCQLTHWGRVTHVCVSERGHHWFRTSDNGLLPVWCQAIIWTNAEILLISPLGTNFNEIVIEIHTFSFKRMPLKMSSGKWRPFCLCLNVLKEHDYLCRNGESINYTPDTPHCSHQSKIVIRYTLTQGSWPGIKLP